MRVRPRPGNNPHHHPSSKNTTKSSYAENVVAAVSTAAAASEPAVPKILRLCSPVGAEAVEYKWSLTNPSEHNTHIATEILETIRLVCVEFPDIKPALDQNVLNIFDPRNYESLKLACDKFNLVIKSAVQMWKGTTILPDKRPSTDLLQHIITISYNYGVVNIKKLNKHYAPFSSEVYGETSFKFVQQMIEEIGFDEDEVFVDLGSGVGQVVLHVAAAAKCLRCLGIEKADTPAGYALRMVGKFKFWMNWFGKKYSNIEMIHDDFFKGDYREKILNATIIFCNNFAFGPIVNHGLKKIFENLKDGTRILSSSAFCSLKFRISRRNCNDIGAMMSVKKIQPHDTQSVSWTGKSVPFFLHTINRKAQKNFLSEIKNEDVKTERKRKLGSSSDSTLKRLRRRDRLIDYALKNAVEATYSSNSETESSSSTFCRGRSRKAATQENVSRKKTKKDIRDFSPSLSALQERTVRSIDSNPDHSQPGCVEQRLAAQTRCQGDGYPNIMLTNNPFGLDEIIQGSPTFMSPANETFVKPQYNYNYCKISSLEEYGELMKYEVNKFQQRMKSDEFKKQLMDCLEAAMKQKETLITQINEVNKEIYKSRSNAQKQLKQILSNRGIETLPQFYTRMNDLFRKKEDYKKQIEAAKNRIRNAEQENENLLNILAGRSEERNRAQQLRERNFLEIKSKLQQTLEHVKLVDAEKEKFQKKLKRQSEQNLALKKRQHQKEEKYQAEIQNLKQHFELQLQQLQVKQESAIAAANASSVNNSNNNANNSGSSPKPNYKEMKYKKYLSRASNINAESNINSMDSSVASFHHHEDIDRSMDSDMFSDGSSNSASTVDNGSINKFNMGDGIQQFFTQSTKDKQQTHQQPILPEPVIEPVNQSPTKSPRGRKPAQPKTMETIKTKKNRQVIVTASEPGCLKTHLVRQPSTSSASLIQDSKLEAHDVPKQEEKPFSFKLKINTKTKKVVNISNVPAEVPVVPETSSKRKRKASSNCDETGGKKKKIQIQSCAETKRTSKQSNQ